MTVGVADNVESKGGVKCTGVGVLVAGSMGFVGVCARERVVSFRVVVGVRVRAGEVVAGIKVVVLNTIGVMLTVTSGDGFSGWEPHEENTKMIKTIYRTGR